MLTWNVVSSSSSVELVERLLAVLVRGVRDEDVELAELVRPSSRRAASQNFAFFRSPGISTQRRPSASTARHRFVGVALLLAEIGDRDVGAFARVQHRDRAADAGIAAGDQRALAFELAGGLVFRGLVARLRIELRFEPDAALLLFRRTAAWARSASAALVGCARGCLAVRSALRLRRARRVWFWRAWRLLGDRTLNERCMSMQCPCL